MVIDRNIEKPSEIFCVERGYCRITVDEEIGQENTSIENRKSIISEFVSKNFSESSVEFFEDRDRSGYTFEQREEYQKMRRG